jgi:hypothetical protein
MTLLDMSDGLVPVFKRRKISSLCCYENFMDDVDYFVVMT